MLDNGNHVSEGSNNKTSEDISEEEAKLYDRQIRLWGVDVQKAIGEGKVLVVGLNGLASEVIKNLVLAGIKAITLVDDQLVTSADALANLFTNHQNGCSRVTVTQALVKQLNPRVKVEALNCSAKDLVDKDDHEAYFNAFNVIVLINQDPKVAVNVSTVCHKLGVPFIAAFSWGYLSFVFFDVDSQSEQDSVDLGTALARKTFFLETNRPALKRREQLKIQEIQSFFTAVFTLHQYFEEHGQFPKPLIEGEDVNVADRLKQLESVVMSQLSKEGHHWKQFNQGAWHARVCGELTSLASIVGGFLSQDIIRLLSGCKPLNNAQIYHDGVQDNFFFGL